MSDYNLINAAAYEVCRILVDDKPQRQSNWIISKIMEHCRPDWVLWKTESTMSDVDAQIEDLHEQWEREEPKPRIIEHPPDGSKAQDLLGGTMEIRAPWSDKG